MNTANSKVALVTGANRGIGYEVCRQLAKKGISVLLGARDPHKGEKAAQALRQEGLDVNFIELDVTDQRNIDRAYQVVFNRFQRLDILVNNAGILIDPHGDHSFFSSSLDTIQRSFDTNTFGAIRMIQTFIPLLKKSSSGRIINLSSGMGQLSEMNGGWPGYRLSKTALNGVTRIVADELKNTSILVNSVCPGWVKTDMGGEQAELSPVEGADTIVWLATLTSDGPTGGFFRERKPIEW